MQARCSDVDPLRASLARRCAGKAGGGDMSSITHLLPGYIRHFLVRPLRQLLVALLLLNLLPRSTVFLSVDGQRSGGCHLLLRGNDEPLKRSKACTVYSSKSTCATWLYDHYRTAVPLAVRS
jgi:hypothetical protein